MARVATWQATGVVRLSVVLCLLAIPLLARKDASKSAVEEIVDVKDFKKLLRTKTNVLAHFAQSPRAAAASFKVFREAAEEFRGFGTAVSVDCSGDGKKVCKKLKVNPQPHVLKHYKDGEYHKDYDRKESVRAIVNFMRDPTGDLPWEEDAVADDVLHVSDGNYLARLLRKEQKPIMVMFYAPWCGFCKRLKPEYADAATELKGHSVLAAIDVNKPENAVVRRQYNITGFPTLLYYEHGRLKHRYEGDNNKVAIVNFMRNPTQFQEKPKDTDWSEDDGEVVRLTTDTFDPFVKEEASVLVMFYAPWCGHCKKMKPEYVAAGEKLREENMDGKLAAVDATKEVALATRFNIRGYPTVKYFRDGEFAFDVNVRDREKILEFMRDPKEPPPPPPPEKPWSEEESAVVHLGDDTFKSFLKKKKHALVMFYAPWCGHCKRAKPEFTAAAENFRDDPKVEFAAVDCTAFQTLCSMNEVRGYPTLKYFHYHNKEVKHYQGGRTAADFVAYMEDPQNPLSGAPPANPPPEDEWKGLNGARFLHHLTDTTFDAFVKEHDSVLVMFYAPWCGHCKAMKPDYARAAQALHDQKEAGVLATIDATTYTGLQERFEIQGFPTIKYFSKGRLVADYNRPRKSVDFEEYMKNPPKPKDEL